MAAGQVDTGQESPGDITELGRKRLSKGWNDEVRSRSVVVLIRKGSPRRLSSSMATNFRSSPGLTSSACSPNSVCLPGRWRSSAGTLDLVPRAAVRKHVPDRRRPGRGGRALDVGGGEDAPAPDGSLEVGGHRFLSRLLVGTGKYPTYDSMAECLAASGAEVVTVAVRRERLLDAQNRSLLDYIDVNRYTILPNTAGWYLFSASNSTRLDSPAHSTLPSRRSPFVEHCIDYPAAAT